MSRDYPLPEHVRPRNKGHRRRERRMAERARLTIEQFRRQRARPNRGRKRREGRDDG